MQSEFVRAQLHLTTDDMRIFPQMVLVLVNPLSGEMDIRANVGNADTSFAILTEALRQVSKVTTPLHQNFLVTNISKTMTSEDLEAVQPEEETKPPVLEFEIPPVERME